MSQMNPDQKAAVEHDRGPLLVLAGAGSGKTLVVTHRIARLIERGTPPRAILAMTFTNKAAEEMLERVTKLVGPRAAAELTISTFHAFGLQVLKAETQALGLRDGRFTIFDQSDQAGTVRELLRGVRADRRFDIWAILTRISTAKNAFTDPKDYRPRPGDEYDEITQLLYPRYVEALRSYCAFDFDDLVCEVVQLFKRRPDVLGRWRQRFWYLMVDEYQDTNHAQLELVRLLGNEHRNVCVVGDDDQAIYAWRGADVKNILDFERHFEGARVVKLQCNYRSTDAILSVANSVISTSLARRHEKRLIATRPGGEKVQVVVAHDPEVEAAFIGDEMSRMITQGTAAKDIAVLYRSNTQSDLVETALRQREIPYRVVGGTQFYERKEVKDLIAYLRVVLNPRDEISLRRIINYPTRGIGTAALERLATHAAYRNLPLWTVVESARTVSAMPSVAIHGCEALTAVIRGAAQRIAAGEPSAQVARWICEAIALEADIAAGSGSNAIAARRRANLESILRVLERHDKSEKAGEQSLANLLRLLSLKNDSNEEDPTNVVTLTTMHGAKGLEYDNVFIAGAEEGIIPHARTLDARATDVEPQDVEEERRLFYVAVTRAKTRLYICRAKHRAARGKPMRRAPSRFLAELPEELIETREVSEAAAPSANTMMQGVADILAMLEQS